MSSFPVRCALRFIKLEGFDRSITISSQVFTALIPLFILVATFSPADEDDTMSDAIIQRFALTDESAVAIHQLFATPPGAADGVTVFSVLLLVYSGVAFTRRTQRMYRAAWNQPKRGLRSTVSAALGLVAIIVGITINSTLYSWNADFPLAGLVLMLVSTFTGLVLWTLVPYLLLDRGVHWRRLVASGTVAAVAMTALSAATPIYMPGLIVKSANQFGLFGITVTLIGWLLVAACLLVGAASVGAEFDASETCWVLRLKARWGLLDPAEPRPVPPAGRDPRGLTVRDARTPDRLLVSWLLLTGTVWIATTVVPGISVQGGVLTSASVSLLLGLVNVLLEPLLLLLVGVRTWIGVAGSAVVVNTALLSVIASVTHQMELDGVGNALLGASVIAVVGTVVNGVVGPVTDPSGQRRRVRHGGDDPGRTPR